MFSWLPWSFWLFFFLPAFDIWASVSLYGFLGTTPLLCFFAGTWLLGGWIFSRQSASVVGRALMAFNKGEIPEDEIQESVGLLIAATLLATPGFLTDVLGFALLTPGLRLYLVRVIFDCVWGSIVFALLVNPPSSDDDDSDPSWPVDI